MKNFFRCILYGFLFFASTASAQDFIAFEKRLSTSDITASMQDAKGNYYLISTKSTYYQPNSPVIITKLDSTGRVLLEKPIELIVGGNHRPLGILLSSSNKLVVYGAVETGTYFDEIHTFFICQLDVELNLEWQSMQEAESSYFYFMEGSELPDSSIAIFLRKSFYHTTNRDSELHLLAFDQHGNLLRQKIFGQQNKLDESPLAVMGKDQEVLLVYKEILDHSNIVTHLLRMDLNFNILEEQSIPGWEPVDALVNEAGSLLLLGKSAAGPQLLKLDEGFLVGSEKNISLGDYVVGFVEGKHQDYGISSYSYGEEAGFRLNLLDTDFNPAGEVIFIRNKEGVDIAYGIISTMDGGYLIYGQSNSGSGRYLDGYLIKSNAEGELGYPEFEEVAEEKIGYEVDYSNTKIQWLDMDEDGDLDMVNLGKDGNRVYEYLEGEKLFSLNSSFLPEDIMAESISQIDIDNDGLQDFYFSRASTNFYGVKSAEDNLLLMNKRAEGLVPSLVSGITTDRSITLSSHWYDFNQDGYLDLLLNNIDENQLYKNNGDGTFAIMKMDAFKGKEFDSYSDKPFCYWHDFNYDGKTDFLISQQTYSKVFLQGEKESFSAHDLSAVFEIPSSGMGVITDILLQDVTLDKRIDLIILHGRKASVYEYSAESGKYHSLPFWQRPLTANNSPTSGTSLDYDNDGDLDVVLNGWGNTYADDFSIAFNHNVMGNFSYIEPFTRQPIGRLADNAAWVDLNKDGFFDLVKSDRHSMQAFMNKGNSNHWLKVALQGRTSNINGIGAQVTVVSKGNRQTRTIGEGSFQNGQFHRLAHFGLNYHELVDSLIVQWPSGCSQVLLNVATDQQITLEESCAGPAPVVRGDSVCQGFPVTATISSTGSTFNWYGSLHGPFLGSSGSSLTLDSMLTSQILFVENADSSMPSRKVPVKFTILPLPEAHLVLKGDTIQATKGLISYKWYLNGEEMVEVEGDFLLPKVSGRYQVEVLNKFGCVNRSEEITVEITDIWKHEEGPLRLFPNPATNHVFIEGVKAGAFYQIFDPIGKEVAQGRLSDYLLPLNSLPQGFYYLSFPEKEKGKLLPFIKR